MEALISWKALLSTLGAQEKQQKQETLQHQDARSPATAARCSASRTTHTTTLSPGSSPVEYYYTPQPSNPSIYAATTPMDAWHSIISTLQGASDGCVRAVHLGSPSNSSPAAAHSTCSSPGMVRQLFHGSPTSSKPGPAHVSRAAAMGNSAAGSNTFTPAAPLGSSSPQGLACAISSAQKLQDKLGGLRSSAKQLKDQLGVQATSSDGTHTSRRPARQQQQQLEATAAVQPVGRSHAPAYLGSCNRKQKRGIPLPRQLFTSPGKGLGASPLQHASSTATAVVQGLGSPGRLHMSSPIVVHPPVSLALSSSAQGSTAAAAPGAAGLDYMLAAPGQDHLVDVVKNMDELLTAVKQQRAGTAAIQQQQHLQQQVPGAAHLTEQLHATAAPAPPQQLWRQQQQGHLGNLAAGAGASAAFGASPQATSLLLQQQTMLQLLLQQQQQLMQQQQHQQQQMMLMLQDTSADLLEGVRTSIGNASAVQEHHTGTAAKEAAAPPGARASNNAVTASDQLAQAASPQRSLARSPGKQATDKQQQQQGVLSSSTSSSPRSVQFSSLKLKVNAVEADNKLDSKQAAGASVTPRSPSSPAGRAGSPFGRTGSYAQRLLQQRQQQSSPKGEKRKPSWTTGGGEAAVQQQPTMQAATANEKTAAQAVAAAAATSTAGGLPKLRRQWTAPSTAAAVVKAGEVAMTAAESHSAPHSCRGSYSAASDGLASAAVTGERRAKGEDSTHIGSNSAPSRGGPSVISSRAHVQHSQPNSTIQHATTLHLGTAEPVGAQHAAGIVAGGLPQQRPQQQRQQQCPVGMNAAVPSNIPRAPDVKSSQSDAGTAAVGQPSTVPKRTSAAAQHDAGTGLFTEWLAATAAAAGAGAVAWHAKPATLIAAAANSRHSSGAAEQQCVNSASTSDPGLSDARIKQFASSGSTQQRLLTSSKASSSRGLPEVLKFPEGSSMRRSSSSNASTADPTALTAAAAGRAASTGTRNSRISSSGLGSLCSGPVEGPLDGLDITAAEEAMTPVGVQSAAAEKGTTAVVLNASDSGGLLNRRNSSGDLPHGTSEGRLSHTDSAARLPTSSSMDISGLGSLHRTEASTMSAAAIPADSVTVAVAEAATVVPAETGNKQQVWHTSAKQHEMPQRQEQQHRQQQEKIEDAASARPAGPVSPTVIEAADASQWEQLSVGLVTPVATIPRVQTPGKAAAAAAADIATPMLANSIAAVLHVSAAWREESGNAHATWSQLLEEWSADDLLGSSNEHSTELLTRQSTTCLHRRSTSGHSTTEDQVDKAAAAEAEAAAAADVEAVQPAFGSAMFAVMQPAEAPAEQPAPTQCATAATFALNEARDLRGEGLTEQPSDVFAESSAGAVCDFGQKAGTTQPGNAALPNLQLQLQEQSEALEQKLFAAVGGADAEQQWLVCQAAQQVMMLGQLLEQDAAPGERASVMQTGQQQQQQEDGGRIVSQLQQWQQQQEEEDEKKAEEQVSQDLLQQQQQGQGVPQRQAEKASPQQQAALQRMAESFFSPVESEASEFSLACLAIKTANYHHHHQQQQQQQSMVLLQHPGVTIAAEAVQELSVTADHCQQQPLALQQNTQQQPQQQQSPPDAAGDNPAAAAAAAVAPAMQVSPVPVPQLFTNDEAEGSSSPESWQSHQQPSHPQQQAQGQHDVIQRKMQQQLQLRGCKGGCMVSARQSASVAGDDDHAAARPDVAAAAAAGSAVAGATLVLMAAQVAAPAEDQLAAAVAANAPAALAAVAPVPAMIGQLTPTAAPAAAATSAAATSVASVLQAALSATSAAAVPAPAVDTEESFSQLLHSLQGVHDRLAHEAACNTVAAAVKTHVARQQRTAVSMQTETAATITLAAENTEESFTKVLQDLQDVHDKLAHEADYATSHTAAHAAAAQSASGIHAQQSFKQVLHNLENVQDKLAVLRQHHNALTPAAARQEAASAPGAVDAATCNSRGSVAAQTPAAVLGSGPQPSMSAQTPVSGVLDAAAAAAAAAKQCSADKRFAELRRRLQESRAALSAIKTPPFTAAGLNTPPVGGAAATAVAATSEAMMPGPALQVAAVGVSPVAAAATPSLALPASGWLQASPLQQLLRRNKAQLRFMPGAAAAAAVAGGVGGDGSLLSARGVPGSGTSAQCSAVRQQQQQQDGRSSVQALVYKWRAEAANKAWQAAGTATTTTETAASARQRQSPLLPANTPAAMLAAIPALSAAAAAASPTWLHQPAANTPFSGAAAADADAVLPLDALLFPMSPFASYSAGAGANANGGSSITNTDSTRAAGKYRGAFEQGGHSKGSITAAATAAAAHGGSMQHARRGARGGLNKTLNPSAKTVGSGQQSSPSWRRIGGTEISATSYSVGAGAMSPLPGRVPGLMQALVTDSVTSSQTKKHSSHLGSEDLLYGRSPPSTGTLQQWVRSGSPTKQLKQRLQAAVAQHQTHWQQLQDQQH